jgi:RNA polymerase sigma-70 factor (ECF subfamily)
MLGSTEEAEDALQDAFLKAFQHLPHFEGRSKFSTWLVRIAINTGLQRVRGRKDFDSLDEESEEFRPRNIQAWTDTPEEFYSREELRRLVEREVMKLPVKYRVALMLRDLEELSTEEAAAVLGLSVPGLKARVLRGRLMLRESMVPYFSKAGTSKS